MSSNTTKFTGLSFDASKVEPAKPLEPVPAGTYPVTMTDGEVKPTADGSGKRFNFELTIADGDFSGRKIFDGLNIENKSAKAQEISQQQLSAICHATGVIQLQDIQQLFGIPFLAKIGFEDRRQDAQDASKWYDARNTFKGAKPMESGAPAPSGAALPGWTAPKAGGAPAPAASPATPPWLAGKAAAPAAPAAAPVAAAAAAAPAKPKGPAAPAPKPAPAAAKKERKFFVFISADEMPLKTETEVAAMLAQGMPVDTQLSLADKDDGFDEAAGWKPASQQAIGAATPPAAATPAGAPVAPPWLRKA